MSHSSVILESWPDPNAAFLGGNWRRFKSRQGIDGMMRINGWDIELLAVVATTPATGQFRRFIEACKKKFDSIAIYQIWNEDLGATLARYGFAPHAHTEDGELVTGMRWSAK